MLRTEFRDAVFDSTVGVKLVGTYLILEPAALEMRYVFPDSGRLELALQSPDRELVILI